MSTVLPSLAVLGSVICLNLGNLWARQSLLPMVGAWGTTALRFGLSAAALLLWSRPWRRLPAWRDLATIGCFGAALAAMNLAFYLSIATLPMGIAVALEFAGPLAVAVFASRRPQDTVWVLLAIGGLALLLCLGQDVGVLDPVGVLCALTAAACWAAYIVLAERVRHLPTGQSVSLGLAFAAIAVVPAGVVQDGRSMESVSALGVGLGVAALSSAIPTSLEMFALHRLPRPVFGVLLSMEPAAAAVMALIGFGERLSLPQWSAIGLIVCASVGSALASLLFPTSSHPHHVD